MKLTIHPHLVLRYRIHGVMLPFPAHVLTEWYLFKNKDITLSLTRRMGLAPLSTVPLSSSHFLHSLSISGRSTHAHKGRQPTVQTSIILKVKCVYQNGVHVIIQFTPIEFSCVVIRFTASYGMFTQLLAIFHKIIFVMPITLLS